MNDLIRAETLKVRTTRNFRALGLGGLALVAVAVTATALTIRATPGDHLARQVLALAGPADTVALLLGVLAVTSEFRYGTMTPALLISPRRTPLLVAKLVTLAGVGLVLGLLAFGEAAAIALPILAARHVASQIDAVGVVGVIAGGSITTALSAAFGVGLGALLRNQVSAIVAALGALYVLEPLLSAIPSIGGEVQRLGLGGIASAASGTAGFPSSGHLLGQIPATGILAGYALVILAAGSVVFRRRDVGG
jgi:ABC-type transport system involved in multi-copper enzyme maturation permease subunit